MDGIATPTPVTSSVPLDRDIPDVVSERSLFSASFSAAYTLPSIMSLSTFTSSSVDNNNVSINCSFTNSSVDSRDDDAYGLHVTFDDDNRPQLRPKDGSQLSTGFEFSKAACPAEKLATVEVSCPSTDVTLNSGGLTVSELAGSGSSTPQIPLSVSCGVFNPVQSNAPPITQSSSLSEDLHGHSASSVETATAAATVLTVSSGGHLPPQKETNRANPVRNRKEIETEDERRTELTSERGRTNAEELLTSSVSSSILVSGGKIPPVCNSGHVSTRDTAGEPDVESCTVTSKVVYPATSSSVPVGNSNGTQKSRDSSPAGPRTEPCSPSSKSSPTPASVTPVRKSVRTHRHPLSNSEFVSLEISPRSRAKSAASKRLSLDSGSTSAITQNTTSRTKGTRSLSVTQPQGSRLRKEQPRSKKHGSSTVEDDHGIGLEKQTPENCSVPEQLLVKPDSKTAGGLNRGLSAEPGELKRKPGRPRKNVTVVNGKTGVQLGVGGSWSSLNSKAAGDSSLGSIGLVSELFSVTPFTPLSSQSHCSTPASTDCLVSKESATAARTSDNLSVPSQAQSPVADVSFALDELSSFEQKHKKKKKKKKKRRKKSRHSSLAEVDEEGSKVVGNLDDLIGALRNVQMSSDVVGQPSQQSEPSSFDGRCVLAKIFSQSCRSLNVASSQQSFVVRDKTSGLTGSSGVPAGSGSRQKTGRKASPLVSSSADAETRQSCLPPKKRHRLHMTHSVAQSTDVAKAPGIGHRRRGRPPKLRPNQSSQKPHGKSTKFCCKFYFQFSLSLILDLRATTA